MSRFADLASPARNELWAILALRHAYGIGPLRAKRLVVGYGSALAAAEAALDSPAAWAERGIVPLSTARRFAAGSWRPAAKLEWAALRSSDCSFFCWGDSRYPEPLAAIDDAPLLLYFKGNIALLRGPAVGVVGARHCTREGIAVAAFFARDLARAGVAVISGMAKGIDRAAHLAGLSGPGGSIAVLGTGIDVAYPACNADLHELLGREGLLLSEFAPGAAPAASHFPVRNRLISGLSQGILVIEAANRSGSLITARLALEQSREVFAVPGHTMAAKSVGCQELIRRGARPAFTADDILIELAPQLSLEARKALDARLAETAGRQAAPSRIPALDLHVQAMTDAEPVLPEGALPWAAPASGKEKKSNPGTGAPKESSPPPCAALPKGHAAGRATGGAAGRATGGAAGRTTGGAADGTAGQAAGGAAGRATGGAAGRATGGAAGRATGGAAGVTANPVLNDDERRILSALTSNPRHIDMLSRALDLDVSRLSGLLTLLEVRGLVRRAPGMVYSLPEVDHGDC